MKKNISMILIFVLAATLLTGCGGKDAKLEDGTYTGTGEGFGGDVVVEVTVEEGKIANVEVVENDETPDFASEALETVPAAIVEKNSTDVDGHSGATMTSNAIKEAVNNALENK